eukprot:217050_1
MLLENSRIVLKMSSLQWAHLLMPGVSFLICLITLIIQLCLIVRYWKKYTVSFDAIFVIFCVILCYATNVCSCLCGLLMETALPSCNVCNWAPLFNQLSYVTTKSAVYLFYLQRARLAQSFNPVIPNYCFTKIFPSFFVAIYIVFMLMFSIKDGDESHCVFTEDTLHIISNKWCNIDVPSNGHYYITGAIILELFVFLFFGYLFVKPLINLITSNERSFRETGLLDSIKTARTKSNNLSTQNINDSKYIQTQELKKALWYNVILSVLSLCGTSLTMVIWPLKPNSLWPIPYVDYMITTITTFFMLGRNRKYLYKTCCCCCWKVGHSVLYLNDELYDDDDSEDSVLSATGEYFKMKMQSRSSKKKNNK